MTESKIPLLALASIFAFSSSLALADETTQAKLHAEAKSPCESTRSVTYRLP